MSDTGFDASIVKNGMKYDLPSDPTDPSSWELLQLAYLLFWIAEGSHGILDAERCRDLGRTKELITARPYLRETLVAAWNNQDYKEVLNTRTCLFQIHDDSEGAKLVVIRYIEILRGKPTHEDWPPEGSLMPWQAEQLLGAMSQPYQGIAVDGLYEYLEVNDRNFMPGAHGGGYYAKFGTVVQSSGTGKTRAILELARKGVLLLYINLRPSADRSGFPLRDDIPADILIGYDCANKSEYRDLCYVFFAAIFKLVRDDLSARFKRHGAEAVESWNNDMRLGSSYRAFFFARLEDAYNEIKKDIKLKLVEEYYDSMSEVFRSVFPDGDATIHQPKLVIAFDEAHSLYTEENRFRRSTELHQVIRWYSVRACFQAVWVLFASTKPLKVDDFSERLPRAMSNTSRMAIQGQLIYPPYCALGWDQFAPPLGEVPLGDVAKAEHIVRYGRPLWQSLKAMYGYNAFDEIFELAKQKLMARRFYNPREHNQQGLAVLSQRFGLDITFGHRDSLQFLETSIASHLRVCITTTENCIWSYTTYPSEPFLSCAAAHLLHTIPTALQDTLGVLKEKVRSGMIDMRKRGELISRLFWLLAKDLFVIHMNKSGGPSAFVYGLAKELRHCSMIPVVEFFKFVFGEDFWSGRVGRAGKDAFKDAYVNFSHWISMESLIRDDDRNVVDQLSLNDWTMRHWQRTCAIQCCHGQPTVNMVIPIYFKSAGPGQSGSDCMSQILISDKAPSDKQSDALSNIKRTDPTIGGPDESSSKPRPYIAILADLGLDLPEVEVTFPTESSARTTTESCLRIRACALSPETYPFLKDYPEVLEVLQYLIKRQEIPLSERPVVEYVRDRVQYGSSAEARHMEWERGSCTYRVDQKTTRVKKKAGGKQEQRALESKKDRKGKQKARDEEAMDTEDGPTAHEGDNKRKSGSDDMAQAYKKTKRGR